MHRQKATPYAPRRTLRFKSLPTKGERRNAAEAARRRNQSTKRRFSMLRRKSTKKHSATDMLIFGLSEGILGASGVDDQGLFQELAVSAPQQRNWRGIITALAVIMIISTIIGVAVLVLTPCK